MGTHLNRLNEAIRTSTHNLCFRVEIMKFRIPLQTPVLLYNNGVRGGKNHIGVFSWWQRPRWASICQQPHHKCCKLKTFLHSEHNNWFWDCSLKGRLAIHRYDQSNTMDHSSIITVNYLWLQIIFNQMCRWIVFKKCRWVVFNCVDELSPKTVSMSCLVDELSRFRTRALHNCQYCRYQAYSDALRNSFFPRTIPKWNSLPSSVVDAQTTEEFKGLLHCFFTFSRNFPN